MMIFGFLRQNLKTEAVAVAFSIAWPEGAVEPGPGEAQARWRLVAFRRGFYGCLTARADELAELADAVLCAGGPVRVLAELSLVPEHLWVPETLSPYAAWAYSPIRPPRRSRRRTRTFVSGAGGCGRPAGGLCCSARCGRWTL